jgi:hypothetical protein
MVWFHTILEFPFGSLGVFPGGLKHSLCSWQFFELDILKCFIVLVFLFIIWCLELPFCSIILCSWHFVTWCPRMPLVMGFPFKWCDVLNWLQMLCSSLCLRLTFVGLKSWVAFIFLGFLLTFDVLICFGVPWFQVGDNSLFSSWWQFLFNVQVFHGNLSCIHVYSHFGLKLIFYYFKWLCVRVDQVENGFMFVNSTSEIIQGGLQSIMNNTNTLWSSSCAANHIESPSYPHGFKYVKRSWTKQGG